MANSVNEEASDKTMVLAYKSAKFGSTELLKMLTKFLKMLQTQALGDSYRGKQSLQNLEKIYHGKQSLKDLYAKDATLNNIEITGDIKSFNRIAKDYGIDYSLKKIGENPPKYAVFFKSRDADIMSQVFNTYAGRQMKNAEKPLSRNPFKDMWEKVKKNVSNMKKPRDKGNEDVHETALTLYQGKQSIPKTTRQNATVTIIEPTGNNTGAVGRVTEKGIAPTPRIGTPRLGIEDGHNKASDWISNIKITDDNIKSFDWIAKKYGIEYSLKRINGTPPTHLVFFKARDADLLNKGFREYVKSHRTQKVEKPSIREKIKQMKEAIKNRVINKSKIKDKGLEL